MSTLPWRAILVAALAYVLLNQLWLAGGNATWVPAEYRTAVKGVSLALAFCVLLVLAFHTARQPIGAWLLHTAATGAVSVGLGLAIVIGMGVVWYRGQFFHDAAVTGRLPVLAVFVLLVSAVAGCVAALFGVVARRI